MKKLYLIGILLLLLLGFDGCNKKGNIETGNKEEVIETDNEEEVNEEEIIEFGNEEFCLYVNSENMDKTIPIINDYFASLSNSLNDEQKLQKLTKWLKSCSCIIDATIVGEPFIYMYTVSEILISFKENGITKDLILDVTMNPLQVAQYHDQYTPMDVSVGTKNYFTIDKVFDFINSLDLDVKEIIYGHFRSTMSSDSLQYILDCLNAKPYTNDGNSWWTTGYLHYLTNQICISTTWFNMKNKAYQADWLNSMKEYKLIEDLSGYVIHFRVREGTEKQWEKQFKKYEFVEWAELNYWGHMILD